MSAHKSSAQAAVESDSGSPATPRTVLRHAASARVVLAVAFGLLFAAALFVRWRGHHAALLYPDGYQYLLMARGLVESLEPTVQLGPAGDVFVPNADAAAKPFYPLLLAGVDAAGLSPLDAARLVTIAAGATVVTAVAAIVHKLSGSVVAGFMAAALLLVSPAASLWAGFSNPDVVAQALALAATLALLHRRPTLGGVLAGLAIATRPEFALIAIAAAALASRKTSSRNQVVRAAGGALASLGAVYLLVWPPIAFSEWRLLVPVLGVAAIGTVTTTWSRAQAAVPGLLALALVGTSVRSEGARELVAHDWPLLVAGIAGFAALVFHSKGRRDTGSIVLGLSLVLSAIYTVKNPGLERYFAIVLPGIAILGGTAVGLAPVALRRVAVCGLLVVAGAVASLAPPKKHDYEMFPVVARQIEREVRATRMPLVTAAPDAYGFWLPNLSVKNMRPGVTGAVLFDPVQRVAFPNLRVEGETLIELSEGVVFARADGSLDASGARLVRGKLTDRANAAP